MEQTALITLGRAHIDNTADTVNTRRHSVVESSWWPSHYLKHDPVGFRWARS